MSKRPFSILCVGDSLTAGSPSLHPYALKLAQKLEEAFPDLDVECDVQAREGEQVTQGGFDKKIEGSWAVADRPFDWTIILGGSNDLNWNKQPSEIMAALERAWDLVLSEGGKVLAMTIPEYKAQVQKITDRREQVNTAILAYTHPRCYKFDLFKALPYHATEDADRTRYWDKDGIHLTADGYDFLGEAVAAELTRIIRTLG
ncbi:SGNH hydrolase-type esterase domain-containing protein [Xylariomycetidae sp. FL0641]|nr:SGNH hydrolase-type esterase domain-containing protein [Xylariomycetidae sp. FL0641]